MKKNALLVLLLGLQSIIVMGSDSDFSSSAPYEVSEYHTWESSSIKYLKDYDSYIQEERRSFSRNSKLQVITAFDVLQLENQNRLSSYRSGSSTQAASSPIKSSSGSPLSQSPKSLPASAVAISATSTLPKPVAVIAGFAVYNPSTVAVQQALVPEAFQASGAPAAQAGYGEFFNSDSDSEGLGCCNCCCFRK